MHKKLWLIFALSLWSACTDPVEDCADGVDNDGDLAVDCGDSDCSAVATCLPRCGDGAVNNDEQCDDGNINDGDGCSSTCAAEVCGDGVAQPNEECDGDDLKGETCATRGFTSGALSCAEACTFETSGCVSASCGNGITEAGEACDDGNINNTDSCTNTCQLAVCGDSLIHAAVEGCDDGNTTSGDGCSSACQLESCGDSIVQSPEQCDDANTNNNDSCLNNCRLPLCGDSVISSGEDCDDTNLTSGDGCDAACTVEAGFTCTGEPSTCATICGDGLTRAAEACDDANPDSGDGCSSSCEVETGFSCTQGTPSICSTVCGDGIVRGAEECDAANLPVADCRANCKINHAPLGDEETGIAIEDLPFLFSFTTLLNGDLDPDGDTLSIVSVQDCVMSGGACQVTFQGQGVRFVSSPDANGSATFTYTVSDGFLTDVVTVHVIVSAVADCANSVIEPGEGCDDGNLTSGDGCTSACAIESGFTCINEPSSCTTTCGDSITAGAEQCDDGNALSGDGCASSCTNEFCGDGVVNNGVIEECDDGNSLNGDGCTSDCINEFCGDGITNNGEGCDDGNTLSGDGCDAVCALEFCGDGVTNNSEDCDDQNQVNTDNCKNDCTLPVCGDSVLSFGEGCDDGNALGGDGCDAECQIESCGDGVVQAPEECDDANTNNNDSCLDNCRFAVCGDGIVADQGGAELCDDGNATVSDGCDSDCTIETGFTCTGSPSTCTLSSCGDGIIDTANGEECDDTNLTNGDGCSSICRFEISCDAGQTLVRLSSLDVPKSIPDNNATGVQSVIHVPNAGTVKKLIVGIGHLSQTFTGDIVLSLLSPQGRSRELSSNNGDDGDGYVAVHFADANTLSVTSFAETSTTITGALKPEQSLSSDLQDFLNASAEGDWNVKASDVGPADLGTLEAWTLLLCVDTSAVCGNGVSEAGEECDDGNLINGDGCNSCLSPVCGDAILDPGESCDDGNLIDNDGCDSDCSFPCAENISGVVKATQDPDTANCFFSIETPGTWQSAETFCQNNGGHLAVIESATENAIARAASNIGQEPWIGFNDITTEAGSTGANFLKVTGGIIGTGFNGFASGEPSNSGNNEDCAHFFSTRSTWNDNNCANNVASFICELETTPCGDGVVQTSLGESCDDGNNTNGDGCSAACTNESGFFCSLVNPSLGLPSECEPIGCGDGFKDATEGCDDDNTTDGDGCSATCTVEAGFLCTGTTPSICGTICGDGLLRGAEACDDGALTSGDGCSATCTVESGFACVGAPSSCSAVCGDGVLRGNEECDDSNANDGDGCSSACAFELTCDAGQVAVHIRATDLPKSIPDNNATGISSTISVSGTGVGIVKKAQVGIGQITHTFNDDLDIFITSPQGTKRTVSTDNGGSQNGYFSVSFFDAATTAITSLDFVNTIVRGAFRPEQSFSTTAGSDFLNQTAAGAWTLSVADDVSSDTGSLDAWSLLLCVQPNICGNGIVETNEQCDDGGVSNSDGCSSACAIEAGFACTGSPSSCDGVCGDSLVRGAEQCDDGNTTSSDGCESNCRFICGASVTGVFRALQDSATGTCYVGVSQSTDWQTAESFCEDNNGYLAVIESSAEDAIVGLASSGQSTWIGFNDIASEAATDGTLYQKVTGRAIGAGFQNFFTGEPNDANGGEDCLIRINGKWNDIGCANPVSIMVCEIESNPCGDGVIQGSEQCDDGNPNNNDGCSSLCTVETGFACTGSPSVCDGICGDILVRGTEQCDDGNIVDNDGCTSECVLAPVCDAAAFPGSLAQTVDPSTGHCYASFAQTISWTDAELSCEAKGGYLVVPESSAENSLSRSIATTINGLWIGLTDSALEANNVGANFFKVTGGIIGTGFSSFNTGEPNNVFGTENCAEMAGTTTIWNDVRCFLTRSGYVCEIEADPCGDGVLHAGEACDDGNIENGDGCDALCAIEANFSCVSVSPANGVPSSCVECGDSVIDVGEECDDGNTVSGDGCGATCVVEFCGDGIINNGELCDDANLVPGDGCDTTCLNNGQLLLTEIDYDQLGTGNDLGEFIEIKNVGGTAISLNGFSLPLINGATDTEYFAQGRTTRIALSEAKDSNGNAISTLGPSQTLLIAASTLSVTLPTNTPRIIITSTTGNHIQNGEGATFAATGGDAVGILEGSTNTLIDALSYEGDVNAVNLPGVGIRDFTEAHGGLNNFAFANPNEATNTTCGGSLIRIFVNGVPSNTNTAGIDWITASTPTPGN